MKKQIFISHTWKHDSQGRDTHDRARHLKHALEKLGWSVWFDETDMYGNIDAAMANGIDNCSVVVFCLTRAYFENIENAVNTSKLSNCLKEWNYSQIRNKLSLPILFEPELCDFNEWPAGVISMTFGRSLYVDASVCIDRATRKVHQQLRAHGLTPVHGIHKWNSIRSRFRRGKKFPVEITL